VLGEARGRLRGEHVGEHVRQVAEHGHEPVVGLGVDRHGARAQLHHEAVQALVEEPAGLLVRREVPDGALEEVRARVLHPRRLGAGDWMAADEAGVGRPAHEVLLRRAHVGHERVVAGGVERRPHELRERAHGRAGEAQLSTLDCLLERGRGAVDRAALEREPKPLGIAAEAHHLGVLDVLLRGKADRSADQPHAEDCELHTVENCLPASSAAASSLRR
jgi:hypothetical protein